MLKNILQIALFFLFVGDVHAITAYGEAMGPMYNEEVHRVCKKFQSLYEKNNYANVSQQEQPIIPKIIHQIWLGSPVPEHFKAMMQTWIDNHPDWEYRLWTDESLKTYEIKNKRAFDTAWNYGAKADILRYELIEEFGGVYVDVDFECIKPLDPLVHAHEFFTSIGDFDYVNNALFGSVPHHPILLKLVRHVGGLPEHILRGNPWDGVGPRLFTNVVCRHLKRRTDGVIYPIRFFHPLPNSLRHEFWGGRLSRSYIESLFIEETFAVHYWAGSWL